MLNALLVACAVISLFTILYFTARLTRAWTHGTVHCLERDGADLDVTFARQLDARWEPGPAVDVARCSAFGDGRVTCDKACLHRRAGA